MLPQIEAEQLTKKFYSNATELLAAFSLSKALTNANNLMHEHAVEKIAVDNVSLKLVAGDRIGIVGRNGAGKSTLLSLLAGLAEPTSGALKVQGKITAIMTLGLGLREDLTGRENIYIDGEIQGKTRDEIDKVISEIINFADIGEFIDYPLKTYSTGMKARLAFAMIANLDPEILIIDEALSVGDAFFAKKATDKIKEICARGKIVIIVSHGLKSIIEICNRCLWMEDGRIIKDGDPQEVTTAYHEAVRKEDELVFLEKFYRHIGDYSYRAGCHITELIAYKAQISAQAIFNTGDNFFLAIKIEMINLLESNLKIQIKRFDGLIVCESFFAEQKDLKEELRNDGYYEINLSPLVLGPGIYMVKALLLAGNEVVAERSIVVEVQTKNAPSGGRTALIYPARITVTKNETYRVDELCLDLTKATQS